MTAPRTRFIALLVALAGSAGLAGWWYLTEQGAGVSTGPTAMVASTPLDAAGQTLRLREWLVFPGQITSIVTPNDTSGRVFATGKAGEIWVVAQGGTEATTWLDLREVVGLATGERGLLSLAFAPDFAVSGAVYVNYTDMDGDTVVSRYVVEDPAAMVAGTPTEQVLLQIEQPFANHNGGQLQFGPDGMLYIGMGDGGSSGDPLDAAEDMQALLGKILRIDVTRAPDPGLAYAIPYDNPYVSTGERPEIFSHGLRNPWRFSFDVERGWIWIADVGQNKWEEINGLPIGDARAAHFGWDTMEGRACFEPGEGCNTDNKVEPLWVYDHETGCSVTGGYVVHGAAWGELDGAYFYSDYCNGRIYALREGADGVWNATGVVDTGANIATFGLGVDGTLYVGELGGRVYVIEPSVPIPSTPGE